MRLRPWIRTPRIVAGALVLVAIAVGVAYVPTLDANSHDLIIGDATTRASGGAGDFGGLDDTLSLVHPLPADLEETLLDRRRDVRGWRRSVLPGSCGEHRRSAAYARCFRARELDPGITRDHTGCVSLWYEHLGSGEVPADNRVEVRWGKPVNQRAVGAYTLGNAPQGAPLATFTSTLSARDGATIRTPVEIPGGGFAVDAVVGGQDYPVPAALAGQQTQFQLLTVSSQAGASIVTDSDPTEMGWRFRRHNRSAHVVAVFGNERVRVEGGTIVHDETPGDGVVDGDGQGDDVKGIAALSPEVQLYVESLTHLDPDVGSPMGVARKTGVVTAVATGGAEITLHGSFHDSGNPQISTGLRTVRGATVWGHGLTHRDRDGRPSLAVVWGQTGQPFALVAQQRELVFLLILEQDGTLNYLQYEPLEHWTPGKAGWAPNRPDDTISFTATLFAFAAGSGSGVPFSVTVEIEDDGIRARGSSVTLNEAAGVDAESDDQASLGEFSPRAQAAIDEALSNVVVGPPLAVAGTASAVSDVWGVDQPYSVGFERRFPFETADLVTLSPQPNPLVFDPATGTQSTLQFTNATRVGADIGHCVNGVRHGDVRHRHRAGRNREHRVVRGRREHHVHRCQFDCPRRGRGFGPG